MGRKSEAPSTEEYTLQPIRSDTAVPGRGRGGGVAGSGVGKL